MQTVNKALVSVIIPTFGRAELLVNCINSVLNQTYMPIEIIVVDDNGEGTENQRKTEMVARAIDGVKYIMHKENSNGSVARNTGIKNANGEYICFLDDDDLFYPPKIEMQIEAIQGFDFCLCGFVKKSILRETPFAYTQQGDISDDVLLYRKDFCSGSALMVRRDCARQVQGFDESLQRFQDYNFLVKISSVYKGIIIDNILLQITLHQGSYKPEKFEEIEQNVLNYIRSISLVLELKNSKMKSMVLNENYYLLIKKALLCRNIGKFVYYSMAYNKKWQLTKRLITDIRRKSLANGNG